MSPHDFLLPPCRGFSILHSFITSFIFYITDTLNRVTFLCAGELRLLRFVKKFDMLIGLQVTPLAMNSISPYPEKVNSFSSHKEIFILIRRK